MSGWVYQPVIPTAALSEAPAVVASLSGMQHMAAGIGDTGAHAPQLPQTLHTIEQGIST